MKFISRIHLRLSAIFALLFLGTILPSVLFSQEKDEVKRQLFREIDAEMQSAREEEVPALAPSLFTKVMEFYRRAEADYQKGERLSTIRQQLGQAKEALNDAVEAAKVTKVALAEVLEARKQVSEIEFVRGLAPKKFAQAERHFQEAIGKAENGDIGGARRVAERALGGYRKATLDALENGPIKEAVTELEQTRQSLPGERQAQTASKLELLRSTVRKARGQEFEILDFVNKTLTEIRKFMEFAVHLKMYGTPKQNKAIYLGWRGYVDTKLNFSEFFDSDFTIMAWFMPQYPLAYSGPIFAENGGGTFAFGYGAKWWGDKDEGTREATPYLFLKIGNISRNYYLPQGFTKNEWHHIVIQRYNDFVHVIVDGDDVYPVQFIDVPKTVSGDSKPKITPGLSDKPTGTLRFGRRPSEKNWQAYGLLDDVAVFNIAVTIFDIQAIIEQKRLIGWEKGLLAGWSFDEAGSNEKLIPPILSSWKLKNERAYRVNVSSTRDQSDKHVFNNPFIIGELQIDMRLPFKSNEVWKVIQGYASGGSHTGYAAFCFDFRLDQSGYENNKEKKEYPEGTSYAPIYASAYGKVLKYRETEPFDGPREPYQINIKVAEGINLQYLHLADDSFISEITGGTYNPDNKAYYFTESQAPIIEQGAELATLGPKAYHLHFAAKNELDPDFVTMPVAFINYLASDDGTNWVPILRGNPKKGQLIMRP